MSHARRQVREAVGTILSDAPSNWRRVFETRMAPMRDVLPYLLVYIESELTDPITVHPTALIHRDMNLIVRGHVRIPDDETVEDEMDAVAAEIETKLTQAALNTQLSSKLKSIYLVSSDTEIVTDENDRTYAAIALTWRVRVTTSEGAPETLI